MRQGQTLRGGPSHATSYGHLLDAILLHATGRDIEGWWTEVAATGIAVRLRPGTGTDEPWPLRDFDLSWRQVWGAAPGLMAISCATRPSCSTWRR